MIAIKWIAIIIISDMLQNKTQDIIHVMGHWRLEVNSLRHLRFL